MQSRPASSPRVYVHTLGCPKNAADSRAVVRSLIEAGVSVMEDPEDATHIVVNTCGFIQEAKEESIAAILDVCANYAEKWVLVMGCLVERYRDELADGIPEVAGWFGLAGGPDQSNLLQSLGPRNATLGAGPDGPSRPNAAHAYLKISDGCSEPCTFCAIPAIKGPYHSVGASEILREARACLSEGARELILVGQDTALWEADGLGLTGLIDLLAADDRVRWLRVMYLQPEHVTDAFLSYMAKQPKLCRYLDVPFQHSHPEVLRRMGRGGDGDTYLEFLQRARRIIPGVSVRTAFIVGFPGETVEQFEHLLDFVDEARFDYGGGFVYSPEEGTSAAVLQPRVRRSVALERLNRLSALLGERAECGHQSVVGSRVKVMIDSLDPEDAGEGATAVGRTAGQAPEVDGVTYVEGHLPGDVAPGDVVTVRVSAAMGYDLAGTYDAS